MEVCPSGRIAKADCGFAALLCLETAVKAPMNALD
jgi:hypothetical protein